MKMRSMWILPLRFSIECVGLRVCEVLGSNGASSNVVGENKIQRIEVGRIQQMSECLSGNLGEGFVPM